MENFDPGSPKYEAARGLLVADLRRLEMHDLAEQLTRGELYEIQSWIAMQVIARLLSATSA